MINFVNISSFNLFIFRRINCFLVIGAGIDTSTHHILPTFGIFLPFLICQLNINIFLILQFLGANPAFLHLGGGGDNLGAWKVLVLGSALRTWTVQVKSSFDSVLACLALSSRTGYRVF